MQVLVIINNVRMKINVDVNVKNWLLKTIVIIWNPSNSECECHKLCEVGEYLDYKNCKCRKRLVDKLVEECTGNIDEVKLAKITLAEHENMYKCSCTLDIALYLVLSTINIEIGTFLFTTNKWTMINKTVAKEGSIFRT